MLGITHYLECVAEFTPIMQQDQTLDTLLLQSRAPATGLTQYRQLDDSVYQIRPLIAVPQADSRHYETACGSASIALTCVLKKSITAIQPSGCHYTLDYSADQIELESAVHIIHQSP